MPATAEVVIAGACRTPIGKFGGALAPFTAADLGAATSREAIRRAGVPPTEIELAIFGHARQAGCGPNTGRQVSVRAGVPVESPAYNLNQACASGLQAIVSAFRAIRLGEASCVLAGGMESMSNTPYMIPNARWGLRLGPAELTDGMYRDGFLCPLSGKLMGETAETLAREHAISRGEQDAFAAESQRRCEEARKAGLFKDEIGVLEIAQLSAGRPDRRASARGPALIEADEHPRDGVTVEDLARLAPVFAADGTVTAGNSSGITDGAAAMVVLSAERARELGVRPEGRIVAHAAAGVDPARMGIGPVPAIRRLLRETSLELGDVDLWELNEAFAAQVLAVLREVPIPRDRMNVHGGAIALGHPIGCSGARIVVTLLHALKRRGARRGVATLCVSGGQGMAILVERLGE